MNKIRVCTLSPLVLLLLLGCSLLRSQIVVTPQQITLRQVQGGPIAEVQKLTITSPGGEAWKASFVTADDNPWIELGATSGTTPGLLSVGLVGWRAESQAPGTYRGTITISSQAGTQSVSVSWTVVPRGPDPKFSYLAGPSGCTQPDGFPDAALCTPLNPAPLGKFQPPPVGGAYADPNFGASVRIMTPPKVFHTYSTPNPLSAKNKYLMTWDFNGIYDVLYAATAKVARKDVKAGENFFWDAYDDEVFYIVSGSAINKYDMAKGQNTALIDYSRDGHGFTQIKRGGTGDTSKDNWISFWAPNEKQVCALDLTKIKTYCADYGSAPGVPYGTIDYTLISKGADKTSGKRYVIVVAGDPGVYSVNTATGKLDFEFRGPEDPESNGNHNGVCDPGEKCMYLSHSDTFEDSAGVQYLVSNISRGTNAPCEVPLVTYKLNKATDILKPVELGGGQKRVMSLWKCAPNAFGWVEDYVACAKQAPYCVISTGDIKRSSTDQSVIARSPHASEIMVMRDNGLEIRRLAESRSIPFSDGETYFSIPRAAIANDGSLVVADSNFGEVNGERVTLIQTGFGKPQIAHSGVVNIARLALPLAPASIASIYGTNLASCASASAASFPLPDRLCGSKVTFNGKPGLRWTARSRGR